MIVFLRSLPGRIIIGLIAAFGVFKAIEHKGVKKERARIEKKDSRNVSKAARAARLSRNPTKRGVRDPYTRSDK